MKQSLEVYDKIKFEGDKARMHYVCAKERGIIMLENGKILSYEEKKNLIIYGDNFQPLKVTYRRHSNGCFLPEFYIICGLALNKGSAISSRIVSRIANNTKLPLKFVSYVINNIPEVFNTSGYIPDIDIKNLDIEAIADKFAEERKLRHVHTASLKDFMAVSFA